MLNIKPLQNNGQGTKIRKSAVYSRLPGFMGSIVRVNNAVNIIK
jgi:hypothetical protein